MLYFTKNKGNSIGALYSGRFAFIPHARISSLIKLVRQDDSKNEDIDKRSIIEKNIEEFYKEEFEHSRLMLFCKSGLILSGLRWLTRLAWGVSKSKKRIYDYYKLRTIFYYYMYPIHEDIVKRNLNCNISKINWKAIKNEINAMDKLVINKWLSSLSIPFRISFVLLYPLFYLIGWSFARSFTLISIELINGEIVTKNISKNSIINTSGSIGLASPILIQRVLNLLKIECYFKNNLNSDWVWMINKFRAERETLENLIITKDSSIQQTGLIFNYEVYVKSIFEFVERWVCFEGKMIGMIIERIILSGNYPDELPKILKKYEQDKRLRYLVNFFYLHGN